jgi:AbrB family looped-hinge helix DNA binding protein
MTHKIGMKGQVVVPKALRDRAGLGPGSPVDFSWEEGHIVLRPASPDRPLGGRFANSGMATRLLEDRATEPR